MIRKLMLMVLAVFLVQCSARAEYVVFDWRSLSETCSILDDQAESLYSLNLSYVPSRAYGHYGNSSTLDFNLDWELGYFRDILGGDIAVDFAFKTLMFPSSTRLQLPSQLVAVSFKPEWTWRYAKGQALQIAGRPGIYSDMEDLGLDIFSIPVSCRMIRAFEPRFSGYAGFELRPGFDMLFMPLIGVKYEISEFLVLEGGLPSIRFDYYFHSDWRTHVGFDWNNSTYSLSEQSFGDRGAITLEDYRLYAGVSHQLSDDFMLTTEAGYVFGESVKFDKDIEELNNKVNVGTSLFFKFGVSRSF